MFACLSAIPAVRGTELTVFAAASLTDVLKEAAVPFEKQTGDKVFFNFAGSSTLARQIVEGAPADVFFSADEAKMNILQKQGLILNGTRNSLLSNTLVIVTTANSHLEIHSPADLARTNVNHLALADPQAVPAGIYSKEFLKKEKLWTKVKSKVIPTENVRAALAAVESGNVKAGMVYRTDAAIAKNIKVAYEVPRKEGPAISYPIAVVKGSAHVAAAKQWVRYLGSAEAAKIFRKYGFIVLH